MWFFFENLVIVVVVTVLATQVIYPIVMDTKTFPMFRRKKLNRQIVEANERLEQDRLAQEASELWDRAYGSESDSPERKEPNSKDE